MLVLVLLHAHMRLVPRHIPVYSQPPTCCIRALGVGHVTKRVGKRGVTRPSGRNEVLLFLLSSRDSKRHGTRYHEKLWRSMFGMQFRIDLKLWMA